MRSEFSSPSCKCTFSIHDTPAVKPKSSGPDTALKRESAVLRSEHDGGLDVEAIAKHSGEEIAKFSSKSHRREDNVSYLIIPPCSILFRAVH